MRERGCTIAALALLIVALSCALLTTLIARTRGVAGPQPPVPAASVAPVPAAPEPPPEPTPGDLFLMEYDADCSRFASLGAGDPLAAALEDWSAARTATTYAMLERNADAHVGELAVFTGRVAEIHDTENGSMLRVSTGPYGSDVLWVESCWADAHLVTDSRVRIYGYLSGAHTYTTQAGWTMTIPSMLAVAAVPTSLPEHVSAARRARLGL